MQGLKRYRVAAAIFLVPLLITIFLFLQASHPAGQDSLRLLNENFLPPDLPPELKERLTSSLERIRKTPVAASWGALGEICMAHEMMSQAATCFRAAELSEDNKKKPDARWIYLQAVIREEVDAIEAISLYQRAIAIDSTKAVAHYRMGRLLARVGRFEEAELSLQMAEQESYAHPLVMMAKAQLMAQRKDTSGVESAVRKVIEADSCGQDLIRESQRLLTSLSLPATDVIPANPQNRPLTTEQITDPWMAGVIRKMPQTANIAMQAATSATSRDFGTALKLYDRLLELDNRNTRAHSFKAMVLMNAGKSKEALENIQNACSEFPNDAMAWSCRANIEARTGAFDAAIVSLKEAIRLKPDFLDAQIVLLQLYAETGDQTAANQQYELLLQLAPGNKELFESYHQRQHSEPVGVEQN